MKENELSDNTEEVFAIGVRDNANKRVFVVQTPTKKEFEEARYIVSGWMGKRSRRLPKNAENLPKIVHLVVDKAGRVTALGLPSPKELDAQRKLETRRSERIAKKRRQQPE